MARIRTIKPEFFTSDDICPLSPLARLLYIGLWCEADREGRMVWTPRGFRRRYLPDDQCDIDALCSELVDRGLVRLYGDGLAHIPTFSTHQHVNPRETPSRLPEPPPVGDASSRVTDAPVTGANLDVHVQVGRERRGKEGKEIHDADASRADASSPDELHHDVDAAYAAFLETAKRLKWSTPRKLDPDRRKGISRILKEWDGLAGWRDALTKAEASDFLSGRAPRSPGHENWSVDLDFLLSAKKFRKLSEGGYGGNAMPAAQQARPGWAAGMP